MEKAYLKNSLKVFIGLIFILLCILFLSSIPTTSDSYAQEKTAAVGPDKIKAILLGQKKWIGELDFSVGGGIYLNDYVFEDHGKKMIVKINPGKKGYCKRKVEVSSSFFRMSGCTLGPANLFYDPDDPVYPFKTKGGIREYGLKLKTEKTIESQQKAAGSKGIFRSLLNYIGIKL